MPYKIIDIELNVDVKDNSVIGTSSTLSTQDIKTAKLIFSIKKDGVPLPLSGLTPSLILLSQDGSGWQLIPQIDDSTNGVMSIVLPDDFMKHDGTVKAELDVNYVDGSSMFTRKFNFNIDRAYADQDLGEAITIYVQSINTLIDDLKPSVDDANQSAQQAIDLINQNQVVKKFDYQVDKDNIALQLSGKAQRGKNLYVVSAENEDYPDIQSCIDAVGKDSANPIAVLIPPGTFSRVKLPQHTYASIIGTDKYKSIIRDDSGDYEKCPIYVQSNAYFSNLTLLSTHNDNPDSPVDSVYGYAVHADGGEDGSIVEFNNCILISYQNAAIGIGMHNYQTVKLVDCELYSFAPLTSEMLKNGALFCHSNPDAGTVGQKLVIRNCVVHSQNGKSFYINDANWTVGDKSGGDMEVEVINSTFDSDVYSELYGDSSINTDDKGEDNQLSGAVKLSKTSHGNNIEMLNYNKPLWNKLIPQNGAENFGGDFALAAVCIKRDGNVYLKGVLKNTYDGQTIFQLPKGFRPQENIFRPNATNEESTGSGTGETLILSDGTVKLTNNIKGGYTDISCSFPSEQ
jgi:hypothetical protein